MNCWFERVTYKNLKELSDKLNTICAKGGIQDVSVVDTHSQISDEIEYTALVKVCGIKFKGYKIDGSGECKVTT